METPNDLRYTEDHEWVRLEGSIAVVGITDYAQGELETLMDAGAYRAHVGKED